MTYADVKRILVPEDNGKKKTDEFHSSKYQKHVACSYGSKLVQVDDKFSKTLKLYLAEDDVYNFLNIMIKGSKYCSDVVKNILRRTCDN